MVLYAIILIAVAVFLLILELFVPSGGLIGFFGTLALVGGIVCLFWVDMTVGLVAMVIVLLAAPFAIGFSLKIFPKTPIGRRLVHGDRQPAKATNYDPALENAESELVGKTGHAINELRPVGTCRIDGKRIECLAQTGLIEPGQKVEVVSVQGIEVKVRPI